MKRSVGFILGLLLLAGCGGGTDAGLDTDGTAEQAVVTFPQFTAPVVKSTAESTIELNGADFVGEPIAPHRVGADGTQGIYTPDCDPAEDPSPAEMAWALYLFYTGDTESGCWFSNEWETGPANGELWIGLGNRATSQWDWSVPAVNGQGADRLWITNLSPYVGADDSVMVLVVLVAQGEFALDRLWFEGVFVAPAIEAVAPQSGFAGAEVAFTAEVTGDEPLAYAWDFGGGATPNLSDEAGPVVTLGAAGAYAASLTVVNAKGADEFEFTLNVIDLAASIYILPDPHDEDWTGVIGSGTVAEPYVVRSSEPPFNLDYALEFSLVANTEPDGSGVEIDVSRLVWDAYPPFAVEDVVWSKPGCFLTTDLTYGYIFAATPMSLTSNELWIVSTGVLP
ncbi:PKD domain-containing protein [bacterium]|nr:PKD domain-containing protein [bacterium]